MGALYPATAALGGMEHQPSPFTAIAVPKGRLLCYGISPAASDGQGKCRLLAARSSRHESVQLVSLEPVAQMQYILSKRSGFHSERHILASPAVCAHRAPRHPASHTQAPSAPHAPCPPHRTPSANAHAAASHRRSPSSHPHPSRHRPQCDRGSSGPCRGRGKD